ncbi:MAG: tetratricopeptide repeat protein [Flavobacteriales bacterium]|nr:tetratricopeptide repeat protein [Flavobacteriales bacterium]
MEQKHLKGLALVLVAATVVTGCNGLGKMNKKASTITYTVDPNPLIVKGDTVTVNINGNFPAKYFAKKALVELTPTIEGIGDQMMLATPENKVPDSYTPASSTALKMSGFQGEKAAGNYTVVPYETGKSFSYSDRTAYKPEMEHSALMLRILGKQGKKEKPFSPVKLADGVITTPYLMLNDDKTIMAKDNFQRVTSHTMNAKINYLVASETVRPAELKDQDIKDMSTFLKNSAGNEKVAITSVKVDAYASPEGEVQMNEGLADKRAATAKKVVMGEMVKNKFPKAKNDSIYLLNPRGEDWEGFRSVTQASDFKDKDLVLRVLEMYPDVEKRESEIKNMAATYNELREDILPQLRRSEIVLNYDKIGYSDEELAQLSKTMPDSLNVEELLKAAANASADMNEQLRIYKECERVHPTDYRAANNVGCIYYAQNKMTEAEAQFQKANSIMDNPISTNNLAAITRQKGDRKTAMDMLKKSVSAGPEVKYNMGLIDIQNGDYGSASGNMSGVMDYNAALSKLLGGDAAGAQGILQQSPEKDSAKGHYLMAIIGARQSNGELVKTELAAAVAQDPALKDKATKDLEFRAFKDSLGL